MQDAPQAARELERLMALYGDSVLRMCYMMLCDRELARDAAQDAFFKAYRSLDTLRSGDTEKAWLMRIAINTCKDVRKSRWWRMVDRRQDIDLLPQRGAEDERPDPTPLNEVMRLPEKYRQVVVLHYYQGMTLAQIAQTLDMPDATVRSRLKRAKDRLHQRLEEWYYDE